MEGVQTCIAIASTGKRRAVVWERKPVPSFSEIEIYNQIGMYFGYIDRNRGVGAQSTLGAWGQDIFAENICIKKLTKFSNYAIFYRKMPEFYTIIAGKIYFPIFWGRRGGRAPYSSASPTPTDRSCKSSLRALSSTVFSVS